MLDEENSEAAGPRARRQAAGRDPSAPLPFDPELAAVLESELKSTPRSLPRAGSPAPKDQPAVDGRPGPSGARDVGAAEAHNVVTPGGSEVIC